MTSSVCPLDFGPASSSVMSLPLGLHLEWHHFCCITIPTPPPPPPLSLPCMWEQRQLFSVSGHPEAPWNSSLWKYQVCVHEMEMGRYKNTPPGFNTETPTKVLCPLWPPHAPMHAAHMFKQAEWFNALNHHGSLTCQWNDNRCCTTPDMKYYGCEGKERQRESERERAIERGLTYIRRRLKYLWMWVS